MRTLTAALIGAALTWCWLAIWRGPARWLGYRIPPATHPDHADRIRVWHHGQETEPAWPTSP